MWRSLVLWGLIAAIGGCWSEEPLIDGFTADQWAALRTKFALPPTPDPCQLSSRQLGGSGCEVAAALGQEWFFDTALSGTNTVSCASCHDPMHGFADDTPLSMGATGPTKRNTISVLNLSFKPSGTFSWRGLETPSKVILEIALPNAMASGAAHVASLIRNIEAYRLRYAPVFGLPETKTDAQIAADVADGLEAYMRRLVAIDSPFERFVEGDDDALDARQRRGFALFVGRAMCVECHQGPLLSDDNFHVTGVVGTDSGRVSLTGDPADTGKFLTPTLRNVDMTGPLMHDGSHARLADVMDFYRWGGAATGYVGDKDPLMAPLDLDDGELRDVESFLRTLSSTVPVPAALTVDTHPPPLCRLPDSTYGFYVNEACVANATCDQTMCGTTCTNPYSDPANCGGCGNVCPANKPTCVVGQCKP